MKYFSDINKNLVADFKTAVLSGLAQDGGLFVPEKIPLLDKSVLENLYNTDLREIAKTVLSPYVTDCIKEADFDKIIEKTFSFPAPVVKLSNNLGILELFHGPTLAFKDFGARFMANVMSYFIKQENQSLNILVATSGDTGSAVAHGFYDVEGINIFLLYPSGKVSKVQEMQLTTLDKNIIALEIDGTFDDCQKLVKQAFTDNDLRNKFPMSSANSINVARLLPQMVYYFEAVRQIEDKTEIVFSVPSGNLGNLTAGLIAKKMGLPVEKFIAATNINDVFTKYINEGKFIPRASIKTYSNAMDVGDPSNLSRINSIYEKLPGPMREDIFSVSFNDEQTIEGIKELKSEYGYLIDPHGSVGYMAYKNWIKDKNEKDYRGIILETAHPSKFSDIIEEQIGIVPEMPERLRKCLNMEKKAYHLSDKYEEFKSFLLNNDI
jgi:threonine synthase